MRGVNEEPRLATLPDAVAHVADGGLLVLPTDTVYGIGCLAADADAVARLLATKGRGRQMPPPVLVPSPEALDAVIADVPPAARRLMSAFWPGALTLVLNAVPDLGWDLGDTGGTLAVRMPDHPLALELLSQTGPLAVTSANLTGQPPATDIQAAQTAFAQHPGGQDERILFLDGGPTPGPVASTILSVADSTQPVFLRDGVISREQIEKQLAASETGAGA